jgi:hypothetical protein
MEMVQVYTSFTSLYPMLINMKKKDVILKRMHVFM